MPSRERIRIWSSIVRSSDWPRWASAGGASSIYADAGSRLCWTCVIIARREHHPFRGLRIGAHVVWASPVSPMRIATSYRRVSLCVSASLRLAVAAS